MIEFESVGKTFRDGTAAVVDLTLTVPSDKITVIVGPSGCGKTTTLQMINRMIEPTSGRILWDGSPLRSKRRTSLRRQMGYVIQSGGLFPHRTVIDNVGTVPGLLGWDKTKTRRRAIELLDSVGLDRKLANRYPGQLSGGQQQRVGVARALAADPMVLLMDEPFSAVDPVVRAELHELFLGLQRELSKTIILITHDIDEAIKLGDQVAILRAGGHLAQVGIPQHLLDEPADSFVEGFIGKDRGYRALSFLPASGLSLSRVKAVRDPESVRGSEPTLVVDEDAKPLGWADAGRPGHILGLGAVFDPDHDTLRVALDSALTSPVGLAVGVSGVTGRYAGVVSASDILSQVTETRASIAQAVSVRAAETAAGDTTADDSQIDESAQAEETAGNDSGPVDVSSSETDFQLDDESDAEHGSEPTTDSEVEADPAVHHESPSAEVADEAPEDEAPADETPADEAPADEAPADEAPADEAPADETPVDDPPQEDDAADEATAIRPAVSDEPSGTPTEAGPSAEEKSQS